MWLWRKVLNITGSHKSVTKKYEGVSVKRGPSYLLSTEDRQSGLVMIIPYGMLILCH